MKINSPIDQIIYGIKPTYDAGVEYAKAEETGRSKPWLDAFDTEDLKSDILELLENYSKFLEKNGYMDADWYAEEPNAIKRFLAHL